MQDDVSRLGGIDAGRDRRGGARLVGVRSRSRVGLLVVRGVGGAR